MPPLPPLAPLPVIDPDILALVMLGGAIFGALAAGGAFIVNQWAVPQGTGSNILPELPPLLVHRPVS